MTCGACASADEWHRVGHCPRRQPCGRTSAFPCNPHNNPITVSEQSSELFQCSIYRAHACLGSLRLDGSCADLVRGRDAGVGHAGSAECLDGRIAYRVSILSHNMKLRPTRQQHCAIRTGRTGFHTGATPAPASGPGCASAAVLDVGDVGLAAELFEVRT